jgi:thiol:disulfide interchange protein DsbD
MQSLARDAKFDAMMQAPRTWKTIAAAFALLAFGASAEAQPAEPRVRIELAPETAGVVPGGTVHVALKQTIAPGWHTYWRNPGDSGEPTTIRWTLPAGWRAGEIVWPTPERQKAAPTILNYGYSDTVLLPVPIEVPANARVGEKVTLKAAASWLVCKDICIPEQGVAEISLPVVEGAPRPDRKYGDALRETLAKAPKPVGLQASFEKAGDRVRLAVLGPELAGAELADAYFFPFEGTAVAHSAPQAVERGAQGVTLTLEPGYAFQAPSPPPTLSGVLALASGAAYELTATPGAAPAGAAGLGPPPASRAASAAEDGGAAGLTLPVALLFAFLGGLILNLMPCVFPILAMKAAALANHAHERSGARLQALAFGAGVLTTFLVLAGALIALQSAGEAIGWGFQLQNPAVIAGLALLMLLVALNLSGVFEVGGSVQNLGSGAAGRRGASGSFMTGVLAVVVAAPCTAPFMAGAMGYALTQSAVVSLAVFLALAVGFALPFVALGFSSALLRRLPKPGPWMDRLRKLLAFPMYGAAAWLAWVFAGQAGQDALGLLLLAAVLVGLGAWLVGTGADTRRSAVWRAAGAAVVAVAAALSLGAAMNAPEPTGAAGGIQSASAAIPAEAFTPERLAELRAEGRPVFVNFTADWCVTCKVNEAAALSSARVADAFRDQGVVYLKADWTRRDAVIARTLAEHGRAGVPLYLLYAPGVEAPQVLPQLLTEGGVVAALRTAVSRTTVQAQTPEKT